jgi:hypothetical protein
MNLVLTPVRTGAPITLTIDDGEAALTQGFGGWESVARPQRIAITRFTGNEPIGQDVPVFLDGYADGRNVEPQLQRLLRESRATNTGEPPTVWKLSGPIYYPEKEWIVSAIAFGDTLRTPSADNQNAVLTRQRATISFLEYVRPDQIRVKRIKRTYKPKGKKKRIEAKGRSIKQITVEFYGTSEGLVAKALGKKQRPPVRDVKKKLGKKRKIRLPVLKV